MRKLRWAHGTQWSRGSPSYCTRKDILPFPLWRDIVWCNRKGTRLQICILISAPLQTNNPNLDVFSSIWKMRELNRRLRRSLLVSNFWFYEQVLPQNHSIICLGLFLFYFLTLFFKIFALIFEAALRSLQHRDGERPEHHVGLQGQKASLTRCWASNHQVTHQYEKTLTAVTFIFTKKMKYPIREQRKPFTNEMNQIIYDA